MDEGAARHQKTFQEVVRFALVGVANTAIYYGAYLVLLTALPYLGAHLIAWAISVVGSFFLNCWFTYRVRPSWRRFLYYPLATLVNIFMTTAGVIGLVEWLNVDTRLAPLIAGVAAMPATFVVTRAVLTSQRDQALAGSHGGDASTTR